MIFSILFSFFVVVGIIRSLTKAVAAGKQIGFGLALGLSLTFTFFINPFVFLWCLKALGVPGITYASTQWLAAGIVTMFIYDTTDYNNGE